MTRKETAGGPFLRGMADDIKFQAIYEPDRGNGNRLALLVDGTPVNIFYNDEVGGPGGVAVHVPDGHRG